MLNKIFHRKKPDAPQRRSALGKNKSVKKWKDLKRCKNHIFEDGARLVQSHETRLFHSYALELQEGVLTVSADHYILCDISKITSLSLSRIRTMQDEYIPCAQDLYVSVKEGKIFSISQRTTEADHFLQDNKTAWLSARTIDYLSRKGEDFNPVGNTLKSIKYVGIKECFCISTDTGRYKVCGVISHNSVTLRSIIFHSLTHGEDIKLGLVDLKQSEFTRFKDMNNVVGVANTVQEAAELLRLCREVMYKRNRQNAERGLTDLLDYEPQEPTDTITIFGHEFKDDDLIDARIDGEEKQVSAGELLELMSRM